MVKSMYIDGDRIIMFSCVVSKCFSESGRPLLGCINKAIVATVNKRVSREGYYIGYNLHVICRNKKHSKINYRKFHVYRW